MSDNENALFDGEAPRDPSWSFLAEIERLTAELALKDQALDEIKALAVRWKSFTVECPGVTAGQVGMDEAYLECADHIQRILTRLDTQGETK